MQECRGRRKEERFSWNEEEIEKVSELEYLDYTVRERERERERENNEDKYRIKRVVRKANMILGKEWVD